jgi:DNA-directed RNA polymerase specialized sigma subunit
MRLTRIQDPLSFEDQVRDRVYQHFAAEGRAPSILELAAALNTDPARVRQALLTLEKRHVLVLDSGTGEVRMAMPFSAVPTRFKVIAGESWWWAN